MIYTCMVLHFSWWCLSGYVSIWPDTRDILYIYCINTWSCTTLGRATPYIMQYISYYISIILYDSYFRVTLEQPIIDIVSYEQWGTGHIAWTYSSWYLIKGPSVHATCAIHNWILHSAAMIPYSQPSKCGKILLYLYNSIVVALLLMTR